MDSLTYLETAKGAPGGDSEAGEAESDTAPRQQQDERFHAADVLGQALPTRPPSRLRVVLDPVLEVLRSVGALLRRPQVAGVLIFGLGVLIFFLLGYIYLFTPLSEGRAQHTLLQEITASPAKSFDLAQGKVPPEGSLVAVLEIPALHLVDAVVEGTNAQDLRTGPGHMPTTALPGQPGNAVIAGRRATFGAPFGAIGSLKHSDVITVVDGYGTYHYKVTKIVNAEGGRHDVVTETKGNQLTLVTAASGFFPRGRLAVVAALVGKPLNGSTEPKFRVTEAELGLAADPASAVLAVFWCLLFLVLLSGVAWLLRHWNQPVVVYVLAVPILIIVALFACESIVGYLPATV